MRRRHRGSADSLGLLLDAICNTFGVVLLIAIVIAIMVQTSSSAMSTKNDALRKRKHKLKQQVLSLKTDVVGIEKAVLQSKKITGVITDPGDNKLIEQFEDLRAKRQKVKEKISKQKKQIETIRAEVDKISRKAESEYDLLSELEDDKEAILSQLELESHQRNKVRSADLPQLKDNKTTEPLVVILRYGRLYQWHRFSSSGVLLGLNTNDFTVVDENANAITTEPKPWAGIDLRASSWEDRLSSILKKFNNNKFRLQFVVYQDSYPEFQLAKGMAVDKGYTYNIHPMWSKRPVYDRGGTNNQSQ